MTDPKYTSPDEFNIPVWGTGPYDNRTKDTNNTTGDCPPIRVSQGQALVLDLQAALMNIRHEINYINSIAGSPGYVADGCQHALDYLSTADDAAAKLSRMLER